MIWHPVQQNTDEPCPCCGKTWMELRGGKVTGSPISKVMALPKKGNGRAFGDPAKTLAVDIATVESGGSATPSTYTNKNFDRGHEEEPIARMLYEEQYFTEVSNGGFFDNGRMGCSTDGNVGEDGIIEIKSQQNSVHYSCIKRQSWAPAYKWQIAFNLKLSGRDWVDFISYCSTYIPDKKLYVKRVYKEEFVEEFEQINNRLVEFYKLIDDIKKYSA